MDTGTGLALSGFFVAVASILIASLGLRKGTQNNDYAQLERRVQLCEEDRRQLHIEIDGLRNSNLWLTQQLSERK